MTEFHFLRPWWWLALLPFFLMIWVLRHRHKRLQAWDAICDSHLLHWMMQAQPYTQTSHFYSWIYVLPSLFFIIAALAGPTWSKLSVPVYKNGAVKVILLDLSQSMLATDIKPDRLARARFLLSDLLDKKNPGQFGMIAYTAEPFVVSPMTEDPQSIAALLPALTPDIMPLEGQNLALALNEAQKLIAEAGFKQGNILVLTANPPSNAAITAAQSLAEKDIYSSIIPMLAENPPNTLFERFARAGHGELLSWSANMDQNLWPPEVLNQAFHLNKEDTVTIWQDQGRWLLIPALFFLLPVFRKGWLQRISL